MLREDHAFDGCVKKKCVRVHGLVQYRMIGLFLTQETTAELESRSVAMVGEKIVEIDKGTSATMY